MAASGRSYYPNTPDTLEQALAGSVADGTSVWGPLMMMSARHERQKAIDDVNETQAQQFMLGLKSALDQAHIKAEGDIYGQGLRGGHNSAATMQGANAGGFTHFDPTDIETQRLLGNAQELAGVGKDLNAGAYSAAQAGQGNILSGVGEQLGLPSYQGAPLGVQEHNIAAGATLGAAAMGLEGKKYAADHKAAKTTKETPDKLAIELPGGGTLTHNLKPGELSPDDQAKVDQHLQQAGVTLRHSETGTATDASGDSPQVDPELAAQQAHLVANGYALANGHGAPRVGIKDGRKGKFFQVTDPQGKPTEVFIADKRV